MFKIAALNVSTVKGIPKSPVSAVTLIENFGIEGDVHAGTDRQLSLLAQEAIDRMRRAAPGLEIAYGAFAENIVLSYVDLRILSVGARLRIGDTELEITRIGKECHKGCVISQTVGTCIMPTEGLFARVTKGGVIHVGDTGYYLL